MKWTQKLYKFCTWYT